MSIFVHLSITFLFILLNRFLCEVKQSARGERLRLYKHTTTNKMFELVHHIDAGEHCDKSPHNYPNTTIFLVSKSASFSETFPNVPTNVQLNKHCKIIRLSKRKLVLNCNNHTYIYKHASQCRPEIKRSEFLK